MTTTDQRYGVDSGKAVKVPCRCATTANITLSGTQTIDGIAVVADDRVLVKDQTTATENGIYVASSGNWTRALDFDGSRDVVKGTRVWVNSGTINANLEFYVTTSDPITIDSSNIAFSSYLTLVSAAPSTADYLVKTASGSLSAERVVTDNSADNGVTFDWSTPGQVKAAVLTASSTNKGVVELATDAEAVTGTSTSLATTPANVAAVLAASAAPISGGFRNLVIANNSATPNTQVDFSADALTVESTGAIAYRLRNFSVTIACSLTGANGLDTGSLSTQGAWYSVWAIYSSTGNSAMGLCSTSTSSPTMPTGYNAKARFGWMRTNAAAATFMKTIQKGRRAVYTEAPPPYIANGSTGTVTNPPTWIAKSVANYVPTTASEIILQAYWNANTLISAPSTAYGGHGSTTNAPPYDNTTGQASMEQVWTLEATTIQYASSGSANYMACKGWLDNL